MHSPTRLLAPPATALWRELWQLGKPRVVLLIVFCALAGMLLAPGPKPLVLLLQACAGIALLATAAAAANCLFERQRDGVMLRTRSRPLPAGRLNPAIAGVHALACALLGCVLLWQVRPLLALLTLATAFAYAVVYTRWLKPATPQNIVIGGAAGAMPPLLGWVAVTGQLDPEALSLFLVIYAWTPPHFWALALYRLEDYRKAGLPMLPVTHGPDFTRLAIVLYSLLLAGCSLLPFGLGLGSGFYLAVVALLNLRFIGLALKLQRSASDDDARRLFRFSINYLALLFGALAIEHLIKGIQL
ncbi:heme o synthase [Chitinilyticum litopenaei]|uniref:heme o synthase n=1 Tax=Chitinilyticum litopenaei TaxID=1121276 RepID=UPI000417EA7F|nr:heme o synthase [Chitinilyticum litopenaei]